MIRGRVPTALRPAVLAFILSLAAIGASPFALPVVAQIWISPAILADPGSSNRGLLPAKTALRALSRPRQADPVPEPPERVIATSPVACHRSIYAIAGATDAQVGHSSRVVDGGPRGPPASPVAHVL